MQLTGGILGTGSAGASVAISVRHGGFASELLRADARAAVAEGEAMDLARGMTSRPERESPQMAQPPRRPRLAVH